MSALRIKPPSCDNPCNGNVSLAERLELRQRQSLPVLAGLHRKLLIWNDQLLPKHPMADAVDYTLGQWEALTAFHHRWSRAHRK